MENNKKFYLLFIDKSKNPIFAIIMMIWKQKTFLCFLYILLFSLLPDFSLVVYAQEFSVSPREVKVGINEYFQINYTLTEEGLADFQAPSLLNFKIVSGPNESSSTSMTMSNGQVSMSKKTGISYTLMPKKTGKFTIPAATVTTVNKKTLRSEKINVRVIQGSTGQGQKFRGRQPGGGNWPFPPQTPQQQRRKQSTQKSSQTQKVDTDQPVFLRIVVDTNTVYQGQQVNVHYRLYTIRDISSYNLENNPSFTGFWVQDMTPNRLSAKGRVEIDKVGYTFYDMKTYALFPQRTGELSLDPLELTVQAKIPLAGKQRSWFQQYTTKEFRLNSDTISLNVLPLPEEGKPDNFTGAVGQFRMNGKLDRRKVKANEAISLDMTISGKGNIKLLEMPNAKFPPSFEVFEPVVSENINTGGNVISGDKYFEYTIIPNQEGNYDLPRMTFPYFDPEAGEYKELQLPLYKIIVEKGEGVPEAVQNKKLELKELKTNTRLTSRGKYFFASLPFWGLLLLPFILFPWYYNKHKKLMAELADVEGIKRRQANQVALNKLAQAKVFQEKGEKRPFYDEVIKAIRGYLEDRFGMKTSEMSKEGIRNILAGHHISNTQTTQLINIMDYCEMALYAPVADADNLSGTYQNALEVISGIEDELENVSKKNYFKQQ